MEERYSGLGLDEAEVSELSFKLTVEKTGIDYTKENLTQDELEEFRNTRANMVSQYYKVSEDSKFKEFKDYINK